MSDLYYPFPSHGLDVHDKATHLRERASALSRAASVAGDDSIRALAGVYASFAGCMDLLAKQLPFKNGDRVELVRTPKCEDGWAASKHFLVTGAVGTVRSVDLDYLMRDASLLIEFDDESWRCSFAHHDHRTGVERKVGDIIPVEPERRHVYKFGFDWVRLVTP